MNILAHAAYVGSTGYNSHCQNFFRRLSKHHDVKIRNFTIGKDWRGWEKIKENPHGNDVDELDKSLLAIQTLWNQNGELEDYEIYNFSKKHFDHDVNIVLAEVNHYYFYHNYNGPKIAYTVWENTLYPQHFFDELRKYDQIWVPSQWQAEITEKQGIAKEKIKIIREGVDGSVFYPENLSKNKKFTFVLAGRWDARKSTREIIQAFKNVFGQNENVQLILSVDNPYSIDGLHSTEERLKKYDLESPNIKILHFPCREEYVKLIKTAHVFLSCARSEGWNLPLIEAMACGIPSIYSNCSAQLEFASGKGIPVDIVGEVSPKESKDSYREMNPESIGNWYEPDFKDLEKKMIYAYENYEILNSKAFIDAGFIIKEFSWENAVEKANIALNELFDKKNYYKIHFQGITDDGLGINYNSDTEEDVKVIVKIIDESTNDVLYEQNLFINNKHLFFTKYNQKTPNLLFKISDFKTGIIKLEQKINTRFEKDVFNFQANNGELDFSFLTSHATGFKNENRIHIVNESSSLGDFLAWTPMVNKYAVQNNKKINFYTPYKDLLKDSYPDIDFRDYQEKNDVKLDNLISIGCFDNIPWRTMNLQEIACHILNIKYKEERPLLSGSFKKQNNFSKKYVCIATQSTAQCKYWNNKNGWQKVVDYLKLLDYEVVCIDKYPAYGSSSSMNFIPKNCIDKTGDIPLEDRINDILHCEFFIGLGSGLSWLAWACEKPVIMISGFSDAKSEFYTPYRVINKNVCNSCWNDPNNKFDPSNWLWCPRNKDFECSREISFKMVKEKIDQCIKDIDQNEDDLEKKLSWGLANDWFKKTIKEEIFKNKIYEKFFSVEAGDIVADFGASIGPFTKSILHKKPKHVYCFEPSGNMYDQLLTNLRGENVTFLNCAISNKDGEIDSSEVCLFLPSENQKAINSMTFATFVSKFALEKINFLKTDCEGGEYDIFTEENRDWILKNVDKIVGEWHLSNRELKNKFKKFRDLYLRGDNFWINSVDGVDIKWSLWSDDFVEYYNEIIIYIKNR